MSRLMWGPWTLDPNSQDLVLRDKNDREVYFVPLSSCTSSSEVLDWIAQVSMKRWNRVGKYPKVDVVGHFVEAICDILEPQGRLCSGGANKEVTSIDATEWAIGAYRRLRMMQDAMNDWNPCPPWDA